MTSSRILVVERTDFGVVASRKVNTIELTDVGSRAGAVGVYCAVDVASVVAGAARGTIGVLPSCDDCSAPCGCELSLAAGGVLDASGACTAAGGVDVAGDVTGVLVACSVSTGGVEVLVSASGVPPDAGTAAGALLASSFLASAAAMVSLWHAEKAQRWSSSRGS